MKILIVDDSKAMRIIVMRTLRQAGYEGHEFEEAVNGADGLAKIRASRPDVVLCDWNMPEMNGIDLLRALRAEGILVPFGFVTSESSDAMRLEATEAGATFLVSKPFTAESFKAVLTPLL